MQIKITKEQDELILNWYQKIVADHHKAGCEPPGFTFQVLLGLPAHYDDKEATVICGSSHLEIGPVDIIDN